MGRIGPNLVVQFALYGRGVKKITPNHPLHPVALPDAARNISLMWAVHKSSSLAWFRGVCDDTRPLKLFAGLCHLESHPLFLDHFWEISIHFTASLPSPECRGVRETSSLESAGFISFQEPQIMSEEK